MIKHIKTLFSSFSADGIIGTLFLVVISFSSCNESEDPDPMANGMDENMEQDDGTSDDPVAAPDFSLMSLAGPTIKLGDYTDKVVVLFFFGYNCTFCISAAPTIQEKISQVYASHANFVMFGLDQWNGNQAGVQAFQNTTGVTFPLLMNASATATAYGTTYDRLIVIDKEGNIAYKSNTPAENSIEDVVKLVKDLL